MRSKFALRIAIGLLFVVAGLAFLPHGFIQAAPADAYWVGDAGNWSDAAAHWATSSGGAADAANLPGSGTNVHFDGSSFTLANQTVTVDATAYCKGMYWTGATNNPTLDFNSQALRPNGDVVFIAAMSTQDTGGSGNMRWASSGNLTTNGLTINVSQLGVYMPDTVVLTLQDDLTTSGNLYLPRGTLTTNNHDIDCYTFDAYSYNGTKTLNLGTSTITCTAIFGATAGATVNASSSTISAGTDFTGGGHTYGTVNLTGATFTITGSNTFTSLVLPAGTTQTITFTDGTTQTITTPVLSGDATHTHTLQGSSTGGWTLAKAGGGTVVSDYCSVSYGTGSTDKTWYFSNSTDGGHNTQLYFGVPSAPLNVAATDGSDTAKVVVTWDASAGATDYHVWRDGVDLGAVGDVVTYDDSAADPPTITPGAASASDGTSAVQVVLTLVGASANNGTTHTYKVTAVNPIGNSADSATNTGYRGHDVLTYQWQRSAGDSDAAYGDIVGATTDPYNDVAAPAGSVSATTGIFDGFGNTWAIVRGSVGGASGAGRYYKCVLNSTDAAQQTSAVDRGYRDAAAVTQVGFDYGLTTGYGSSWTSAAGTWDTAAAFCTKLSSLTQGTLYHFRAKVFSGGGWVNGSDACFSTQGSPVVYEYLNTGGDGDSGSIYGAEYTAQQFTANATSHTAVHIKLSLKRSGSPGTVTVELKHANASHEPTGLPLASGTLDGDLFLTSYGWWQFDIDEVSLTASQEYCIVVYALNGDAANYILWQMDSGGGLASAVGMHSHDASSTWTSDTPADYLFEAWGNPCIQVKSGAVVRDYLEDGDMLFLAEYLNIYPPYYNVTDPELYFTIRLLATDGVTPLAVTTMKQWGNKPGAIYLSADACAGITPGSALYLQVYGTFTGNPSSSYQLTATDWGGTLKGWVIATASSMEDYYSTATDTVTFTSFITDSGEVLNDEGAVIFATGIPYLAETHPELFENAIALPTSPTSDEGSNAYESAGTWQAQVGATITNVFNSFGDIFGINGGMFGGGLLAIIYIALVVMVVGKGGWAVTALALGTPIVLFGIYCYLISMTLVAVIITVLAVLAIILFWVSRT